MSSQGPHSFEGGVENAAVAWGSVVVRAWEERAVEDDEDDAGLRSSNSLTWTPSELASWFKIWGQQQLFASKSWTQVPPKIHVNVEWEEMLRECPDPFIRHCYVLTLIRWSAYQNPHCRWNLPQPSKSPIQFPHRHNPRRGKCIQAQQLSPLPTPTNCRLHNAAQTRPLSFKFSAIELP